MGIDEITNSAEYRMNEQNQNLESNFGFLNWKKNSKNFPNFTISRIIKFPLSTNS